MAKRTHGLIQIPWLTIFSRFESAKMPNWQAGALHAYMLQTHCVHAATSDQLTWNNLPNTVIISLCNYDSSTCSFFSK